MGLDKIRQAKYLIVIRGYTQKEAAKKIGVTEATMSKWVHDGNWKNERIKKLKEINRKRIYLGEFDIVRKDTSDYKSKKIVAHYLCVIKGFNQKDAAISVGVTEKTLSDWARKGKWNLERKSSLEDDQRKDAFFNGFLAYVLKNSPDIYKKVQKVLQGYFKELKSQFETFLTSQGK